MEQVKGEEDVSEEEGSDDESDTGDDVDDDEDRDKQGPEVEMADGGDASTSVDELKMDQLEIADEPNRSLSRSPPQSQREEMQGDHNRVKDIVSSDILKKQAQQQRKYHSKRSVRNAGRAKGSKAKQDTRIKVDKNADIWG